MVSPTFIHGATEAFQFHDKQRVGVGVDLSAAAMVGVGAPRLRCCSMVRTPDFPTQISFSRLGAIFVDFFWRPG